MKRLIMNCSRKHVSAAHMLAFASALLAVATCFSQYSTPYGIRPEEHRALWYAQLRNTFDSAQVACTVGEFHLHTSAGLYPVWIAISRDDLKYQKYPGRQRVGTGGQGIDTVLRNAVRTVPFAVPTTGGDLSFVRLAQVLTCHDIPETDFPTDGSWNPNQSRFLAGKGRIQDTSVFVIEIADASTQEVLCVLDSILILPNPSSVYAPRSGSYVDSVYRRSIPLPAHTWGRTVVARVRPERYGPTPFGMVFSVFNKPVALSKQWNQNQLLPDSTLAYFNEEFQRTLHDVWFQMFVQYVVGHIDSTGCIPLPTILGYNHTIGAHQFSIKDSILRSWLERDPPPDCRIHNEVMREWYMTSVDSLLGHPKQRLVAVRSRDAQHHHADIDVEYRYDRVVVTNRDGRPHGLVVSVIDLRGQLHQQGRWSGVPHHQTLEIPLTEMPAGPYIVTVTASEQSRTIMPIVVLR